MRFSKAIGIAAALAAAGVRAAHNVTAYAGDATIQYTGFGWTPFTNCGGTRYTYGKGAFFTFTFTGVAVYMIGTSSTEGGVIDFTMDGQGTSFDRYAPPPYRCDTILFSRTGLTDTQHTLIGTLSGNSPANAGNTSVNGFVELQLIMYTQRDAADFSSSLAAQSTTLSVSSSSAAVSQTAISQKPSSNAAAIGGGIGGAIAAILLVGLLIWWILRRKKGDSTRITHVNSRADLDAAAAGPPMQQQHGGPGQMPPPGSVPGPYGPGGVPGGTTTPAWTPYPNAAAPNLGPGGVYGPGVVASPPYPLQPQWQPTAYSTTSSGPVSPYGYPQQQAFGQGGYQPPLPGQSPSGLSQ